MPGASQFNVVFFCTDQQRWDQVGFSGNPDIHTPNIDALADSGVVFDSHITPSPFCMPSRASMFTGLYPRHHKLWNHYYRLNDQQLVTLPEVFRRNGYRTHASGKMHLTNWGAHSASEQTPEHPEFWIKDLCPGWRGPYMGFDTLDLVCWHGGSTALLGGHYWKWVKENKPELLKAYAPNGSLKELWDSFRVNWTGEEVHDLWKMPQLDAADHYNTWIADRACRFVDFNKANPFFLYVSFPDPHHPYTACNPYCDACDPDELPLPKRREGELDDMPDYYRECSTAGAWRGNLTDDTLRRIKAQSYGMCQHIDDCVGRVMQAVDDAGLSGRTIYVFTSDHGEMLGDHWLMRKGCFGYRELLRVPMVIAGEPIQTLTGPRAVMQNTSHIDLMPTLLSLCRLRPVPNLDGIDLTPMMQGRRHKRNSVLCEWQDGTGEDDLYVQHLVHGHYRYSRYPNRPGWRELFDLEADPEEFTNLAGDERYDSLIEQLDTTMDDHYPPVNQRTDVLPFYEGTWYYEELVEGMDNPEADKPLWERDDLFGDLLPG